MIETQKNGAIGDAEPVGGSRALTLFSKPTEIILGNATSIEEVSRWADNFETDLTFEIARSSGFGLFAESIALGRLRQLLAQGVETRAQLSSAVDLSDQLGGLLKLPDTVRSIFGLALLWSVSSYLDATGSERAEELRDSVWRLVQRSLGEYGDGKRRNILCRDPNYPLPQCLLRGNPRRFPDRQQFRLLLQDIGRKLGGGETFGQSFAEERLITFLYEAARNSHEHGRFDQQNRIISGIRGIWVEKLVFSAERELERRANIPEIVRKHLKEVWKGKRGRRFVIAFTVADLGLGIHNTVPQLKNETAWQRFLRAFEEGVSRKPGGIDMDRGMGLSKLLECATKLNGFLFVHSADIAAYRDFSSARTSSRGSLLTPWPCELARGCAGTSLTMLWPVP